MAVRKKRKRGKNTKFKTVKGILSQIAKIGQKPFRAVRSSLRKIGAVLFACTGSLKKGFRQGFQHFIRLPHALRIVLVYLLTVMMVGGIFIWRTAQLRNVKPDPDQFSFDWADDWERFRPGEGDAGGNSEIERLEPAVSEPDPVSEQPSEPAQPDYSGAGLLGIWPVTAEDREILFEFEETVIEAMGSFRMWYKYSEGIAVKAEPGAKVQAIWGGTVTSVTGIGSPPSAHSVTIKHDNGIEAYYRSLADVHVQIDDRVESGSRLGILGSRTYKGHAYLYLEMKENGIKVDPCSYLPDAALITF